MHYRITLIALLGILALSSSLRAGAANKRLDIYWIDTEGGAATLIVTPAGESVLIDAGNPGERDPKRIHKVAAEVAGLKQIDILVTTHFHVDHFGGAAGLSGMIPIKGVYDNGEFTGGWERPSEEYLQFPADKRLQIKPGDELPLKQTEGAPKLAIKCLAARRQFIDAPAGAAKTEGCEAAKKKREDTSDNANSIVQLLSFGDFRFFDGGDLTWNMEAKLACPVNLVGRADIFQATHHGLDISNNPLLIDAMKPTVVVFGNGPTKGCMPEPFETVKKTPSVLGIYQLHKNLRPGEEKINVPDEFIANQNPTDHCEGNYVQCTVAADGKSYTMSIPATKHDQTFPVKP